VKNTKLYEEFPAVADELAKMGDIEKYRLESKENNRDFLYKWTYCKTLFQRLFREATGYESLEIVEEFLCIGDSNPSLKGSINEVIENLNGKKQTKKSDPAKKDPTNTKMVFIRSDPPNKEFCRGL
jgi:hypothetical protein